MPANILFERPFSDYYANIGIYICYVIRGRFFCFLWGCWYIFRICRIPYKCKSCNLL
ncbi:hypothetical protein KsCSTR_14530 [Candidatus Kuenenia stuttgartiensis]|uniref:Uncharacterized protein n=1 Tax=Kuenenia stuttgartiensis TaxID=174633 RepID=Q1Q1B8_KUEST|nr:hypothetical protein KsCSTR_14530 [Candidatus Kuenenia stuttgartiensis]CAJ73804.1 unknown protein [Candidatus Kuenenia stuttgartiensis]